MLPRPPRPIQLVAQRAHADAEQLRRARTIVARRLRRPETEKSRQTPTTRLQPAAANGVLSSQRSGCRGSEDGWNRRVGIPIPLLYWTSAESRQNGSACHKKPGPNRSRPWEQSRARLALPLVVHRVMPAVGTTTADAPACLTTLAHAVAASRGEERVRSLDLESPADLARLTDAEAYLEAQRGRLVIHDEIHRRPELFALLAVSSIDVGVRGCVRDSFWCLDPHHYSCCDSRQSRWQVATVSSSSRRCA